MACFALPYTPQTRNKNRTSSTSTRSSLFAASGQAPSDCFLFSCFEFLNSNLDMLNAALQTLLLLLYFSVVLHCFPSCGDRLLFSMCHQYFIVYIMYCLERQAAPASDSELERVMSSATAAATSTMTTTTPPAASPNVDLKAQQQGTVLLFYSSRILPRQQDAFYPKNIHRGKIQLICDEPTSVYSKSYCRHISIVL